MWLRSATSVNRRIAAGADSQKHRSLPAVRRLTDAGLAGGAERPDEGSSRARPAREKGVRGDLAALDDVRNPAVWVCRVRPPREPRASAGEIFPVQNPWPCVRQPTDRGKRSVLL